MEFFGFAVLAACAVIACIALGAVMSVSKPPVWARVRTEVREPVHASAVPVAHVVAAVEAIAVAKARAATAAPRVEAETADA